MNISAPRYCQVSFPRYRFLPGRHPHPTAHPDGHSYHPPDDPPVAVEYKSADQWRESVDYLYGCDLYNHGYWWEAHEAWEGLWQLTDKDVAMAEAYEVNVAPHNFYGHMSTLMSAHFSAAVANFRIMEIDVDDVPWKDDLVTEPPKIEDGHLLLPTGPGWGADPNEEAIRAHPPK